MGGAFLLISAAVTAVVSAARARAGARVPEFARDPIINMLWSSILLGVGFLLAIAVFLSLYKLIPDRPVPWLEAASGAVVSAVLWHLGSFVFLRLVPYFDYQKVYGRTGAIVALLTWVYTSSMILLFGAYFSAKLHVRDHKQQTLPHPGPKASRTIANIRSFPGSR